MIVTQSLRTLAIAVVCLAGALTGVARAAESVVVAAGQHPGYGRIAFRWPSAVDFKTTKDGDVLVVRFERPMDGKLGRIARELDDYVSAASFADGGKSVRLALKRPVKLRTFKDTPSVAVVDLVATTDPKALSLAALKDEKPAAKSPPASKAKAAAEPKSTANAGQTVGVRLGEHKGFDRLVFDWHGLVGYKIVREEGRATIHFATSANIDLSRFERDPPRYAPKAKAEKSASGATVTFELAPGVQVRDFRDGPRVALDFLAPANEREAARKLGHNGETAKKAEAAKSAEKAVTALAPTAKAGAEQDKATEAPVMIRVEHPSEPLATGASPDKAMPAKTASAKESPAPAAAPKQVASKLTGGAPADVIPVEYSAHPEGASLRFTFTDQTGLAVFRRADHLWIVFDRPSVLDFAKLPASGDGKSFESVEQLPHLRGTVMRLKVPYGIGATIKKQDFSWIVSLATLVDRPDVPIAILPQPNSAIGPRVNLPIEGASYPLEIADPDVGDKLVVVPVAQPGWGIFQNRTYVEFRLLDSAQGIVVEPKVDGIIVTAQKAGVDILGERGLALSSAPESPSAGLAFGNAETTPSVFNLAAWRGGESERPIKRKQALQLKLAAATPKTRNRIRLELARFYFAEGLAPEAEGLIGLVSKEQPAFLKTPEIEIMRGALATLRRDYKSAMSYLGIPQFATTPEAALWRGAVDAEQHDYARAEREFLLGGALIGRYPRPMRVELGLLAAETLLARGDQNRAKALIAGIEKGDLSGRERGRIAYLHGREMVLADRPADALPFFEEATKSDDPLDAARAILARVEMLEKIGKITRKEAIERLDKLRYAWRGDDFELDLLDKLGRLRIEDGDYREGLVTLRKALTYFPTNPRAKPLAAMMSKVYADLFVKGEAKKLSPVTAVAIHDEFKELSPTGAEGDQVLLNLVDRLVAVDLLGRAEKTLDDLIKHRLNGVEKARAGTRLAKIYLMDDKPADATAALAESVGDGIDDGLASERRELAARALAAQGQTEQALAGLESDTSPAAERIRAEAYWKAQDWTHAAQAYDRLTKELPLAKKPLDQAEGNFALRWAIALTMLGDRQGTDALRARFEPAFAPGPARDAFLVITSDTGKPEESFRKLATTVAEVSRFKSFMEGYRAEFVARAKGDGAKLAGGGS